MRIRPATADDAARLAALILPIIRAGDSYALPLDMSDDGVGGADPRGGTGIVGMANRIRLMGGQMSLDSPPGGPTRLRASCPAPLAAEEDRASGRGHPPLAAARPERGGE